jgi:hypothetical protein
MKCKLQVNFKSTNLMYVLIYQSLLWTIKQLYNIWQKKNITMKGKSSIEDLKTINCLTNPKKKSVLCIVDHQIKIKF